MERISYDDDMTDTLGQLILAKLPPENPGCCISHSAYNPQIYYHLCRVLTMTRHRPEVVILPVNMRCFSPQWDLAPLWQFDQEIEVIEAWLADPGYEIPIISDPVIDETTQDRFLDIRVEYPGTDLTHIRQFVDLIASKPQKRKDKRQRIRHIFIYHYMHPLKSDHRKLLYLQKTLALLRCLAIDTVLYFTPVNYQAGMQHVGPLFLEMLTFNVQVVCRALLGDSFSGKAIPYVQGDGFLLADYSMLLSRSFFFHDNEPTEHLNEQGRRLLADRVAELVRTCRFAIPMPRQGDIV